MDSDEQYGASDDAVNALHRSHAWVVGRSHLYRVHPRIATNAPAFWCVNFGTAGTLPPGKLGFAAGMGRQAVFDGDPTRSNAFFVILPAGLRVGLLEPLGAGWPLAPVPGPPLPWARRSASRGPR